MIVLILGCVPLLLAFSWHWIAGVVVSAICLLLLLLPIEGFEETEKDDIELIRLKRGKNDHTYYIEIIGKNKVIFAYDNSDMYDLNGGAYEEDFRKGKIKVYESSECEEPILRSYTTRPSREFFTFAPFSTKREYVFYVPEGTVINYQYKRFETNHEEVV